MDKRRPARDGREGLSRRDFARRAALAAAGVAVLPRDLMALAVETKPDSNAAAPKLSSGAPPEPKLSDASRAEAEARIDAILRKRGDRLSEAQKAEVRRIVLQGQKSLDTLRTFPLANSDEPATVLHLQVHEEA